MSKPELVLSNTTSFFIGGIKATFRTAKKLGFKYVEVIPYPWTKPEEILKLEKKYGVQVAGIHMPVWWGKSMWQELAKRPGLWEKSFVPIWQFFLGNARKSPGLKLAEMLGEHRPYLIFHTNALDDMGKEIQELVQKFHILAENLDYHQSYPRWYWDLLELKRKFQEEYGVSPGFVFDHGHFRQTVKKVPDLNLLEIYRQIAPEVVHVSYNNRSIHSLPNQKEQMELGQMLKIHSPKYLTLETNPFISVKKGLKILEQILAAAQLRE